MGLNSTPRSERFHISIFGKRNAGKSSLLNALANQDVAVVSEIAGTTTDLVYKSMEILPLGPVVILDTPGLDDEGALGALRVKKAVDALKRTDAAILAVDATEDDEDNNIESLLKEKGIPFIKVYNKVDLIKDRKKDLFYVSAKTKEGIKELREELSKLKKDGICEKRIVSDLIKKGSFVTLVIPIDESAPKGRIILAQQQTLRDILDFGSYALCVKDDELEEALKSIDYKTDLVITDSQAFKKVSKIVPENIPLTSFSILMARYKGFLSDAVKGVSAIEKLKDGDKILIAEGCTHHRQCQDIGSVKIPSWIREYTGKDFDFSFSSGIGFPEKLEEYSLVIHCGGCMLNEKEVLSRLNMAKEKCVPFTNYGILISYLNGILKRSISMIDDVKDFLS